MTPEKGRTDEGQQTTRQAMTDLLSHYPGVIVNVVHGADHACATLNRHGTRWTVRLAREPQENADHLGGPAPDSPYWTEHEPDLSGDKS